jgi:hypothetical protein
MLYEVDVFNIKATLVEPGHMRLDEPDTAAMGLKKYSAFKVKTASEPYAGPNAPAGHAQRMVRWLVDRQPVSTVRSAELVWQLAHCSYPPLRLLLGSYAVDSIRDRLRSIIEEVCQTRSILLIGPQDADVDQIEDWKHLSFPVSAEDMEGSQELTKEEKEEIEMED